ncbi:MAG: HetP family heterocyst commitment protein [Nostoc sp. SerVER01]|uniref:HetP family heterocyst commitment protein n=1 Tax=Nostoc sp. CCY 9925 TaxID=3103865 RepID=UPI002AD81B7A|nr:HetP family heterocyst commitment protein [Nostoc sp. SerVER01]MDZ8079752.1 HetP family heterocyst commitment protein [Nostoc sp. DcaGUA01]MDZ8238168.1 HetP family heterocyst commitment protein [Nostoc sp. ChiQUE01a]
MNPDFFESNEALNKKFNFNHEELEEIIKAVRDGKYSWACLLMLRFSGYNPLEYIPSRTYIRLMKNNCLFGKANHHQSDNQNLAFFELESTWFQQSSNKHDSN